MSSIVVKQIEGLLEEKDQIAALSNISACINQNYDNLNWAGFYLVKNGELVLGPFQGKVACTHIPFDKGVCGLTYRTKQTQRVDDVLAHQDHIACDADSRSELCVPILVNEECVAMIDLDAPIKSRFTEQEEKEMQQAANLISTYWIQYQW
ncbi:MAG: GAF domain-containing protein [Solobacterium sp.]|nr:GAF domain-containing protein [Solobacterium sp.]